MGPVSPPLTHRQLLLSLHKTCHYIIIALRHHSHAVMQPQPVLLKFGHIKNTHIELRTARGEKPPVAAHCCKEPTVCLTEERQELSFTDCFNAKPSHVMLLIQKCGVLREVSLQVFKWCLQIQVWSLGVSRRQQ